MRIQLISQADFNLIKDAFTQNEALVFQNNGYEYLNLRKLSSDDLKMHETISDILKKSISGFSSFNNLLYSKEGERKLRFQYNYNYDDNKGYFIGVGYILLDELLNGFN